MKRCHRWFLLVLICLTAPPAWAKKAPDGSPTRAIQELDDTISKFRTGKKLSAEDEKFNRDLKHTIIHGTFDVRELCRLALSSHWDQRNDAE
ncbi:MAG: hypothetical protein HY465_00515, partial [Deltaproteobacteria bacterium]|nr:hypothetical protein [Deltaproteobacteria bacterium]